MLDPSNKGFQMMAKLGFKPGDTLGKPKPKPAEGGENENEASSSSMATSASEWVQAHAEPLRLVVKEDRGGIGLDTEKKRKFREEAEQVAERAKAEVGEYRERMRAEREERRIEAQILAAQKVAEKLDIEAEEKMMEVRGDDGDGDGEESSFVDKQQKTKKKDTVRLKSLSQIPVVYRGMVRAREEQERLEMERRRRETSLPSSFFPRADLPGYEDPTLDRDDIQAIGASAPDKNTSFVELEADEPEDPELEEFNSLDASERLRRVVTYLREQHCYCFWCKYRYETKDMEGCPGLTEEDHD